MRPVLAALTLCLSLAACGGFSDAGPAAQGASTPLESAGPESAAAPVPDDVGADAASDTAAGDAVAAETAAQQTAVEEQVVEVPPEPPLLARQRSLCREQGGQLMARGSSGLFACVQTTGDGGRACDEGSDCEGLCLARSGTCAPLSPIFGCQEVFTSRNRRETLCTE